MGVSVEIYRAAIGFLIVTFKQTLNSFCRHFSVIIVFLILLFFGQSRTCLFICLFVQSLADTIVM